MEKNQPNLQHQFGPQHLHQIQNGRIRKNYLVYWTRQALVIFWGVLLLKRLLDLLLFLNINAAYIHIFCSSFSNVDEHEYIRT